MQNIGKYQIVEKIGVGGFGEVYKGYDPFIKRHVAVKTCTSDDEEIRNRFFQEAEIAGNLHHRNVTTVYDFGIQDGLPYLVQEYLSGEDLDHKVKRRDFLPFPEKLYYLLQIARGLAYAHSQGVIHRDIKPANVRILGDGTAKIMDFGIAKLAQSQTGLTQTGMTLGTAAYLAPEQIRGDAVDLRTDVFSFGVLAYELLTYERPFKGEQISAVLYQILNQEPEPIRRYWPDAPADVVTVIERCLSKDPSGRFLSAAELLSELEQVQRKGRLGRLSEDTGAHATSETRAIPTTPPPSAVTQPAIPTRARTPTPSRGIDDLELSAVRRPPREDGSWSGTGAYPMLRQPRSGSRVTTIVLLAALAAVALGVGWWLGRPQPGPPIETLPPPAATAADGAGEEVGGGPGTVVPPAPVTPPGETAPANPVPPPTDGGTVGGTDTPSPPPPAPPPPPEPGTLVIPAVAWADGMTVSVGGRSLALNRPREVSLTAGTYTLSFDLRSSEYSASRKLTVTLGEGERREVRCPIERPGQLSVRAALGKPQARLVIDGREIGRSPVSAILEPGPHEVELVPEDPAGGSTISDTHTLDSGTELILTFDLSDGTVRTRSKALSGKTP